MLRRPSLIAAGALALVCAPASAQPSPPDGDTPAPREAIFPKSDAHFAQLGPAGPYYPQVALARRLGGEALLNCSVTDKGALKACKIISETPRKMDFGKAALVMSRRGWIAAEPRIVDGQSVEETNVLVRVPFELGRR